jgi:hypothetical protein
MSKFVIEGANVTELINLIYGSSAKRQMADDQLLGILSKARNKNGRLGVTGMLLYRGGNFLQVLEGDKAVVEGLFDVIKKDERHHLVDLIAKRPVAERGFGAWEMGFVHIDTLDPTRIAGYTTFLKEPLNSERFKDMNFAYTFLEVFKEGIR